MTPMTTQATPALTPAQRQDVALCAKALTEVRVALELALGIIGQMADGAS